MSDQRYFYRILATCFIPSGTLAESAAALGGAELLVANAGGTAGCQLYPLHISVSLHILIWYVRGGCSGVGVLQTFKAELFKALGHPVRIRILELLRNGEQTVSELQAQLEIDPSSVSQQLAVLRNRQLVVGRKQGTSVYYSAVDPQVYDLLDVARAMFNRHLLTLQAMADEDDSLALDLPHGTTGPAETASAG